MIPDLYTRTDLKSFVFKSCVRMPQVGDYFRIPWDGWKWVWRVHELRPDCVVMERPTMIRPLGPDPSLDFSQMAIRDTDWVDHVKNDFIRSANPLGE